MKFNLVMGLSLVIGGCGWGQIPLHNQFDFQIYDSEAESEPLVVYSDEEIYSMVDDFPAMEMIDEDIRDNNNVGFTSFRGEDSLTR